MGTKFRLWYSNSTATLSLFTESVVCTRPCTNQCYHWQVPSVPALLAVLTIKMEATWQTALPLFRITVSAFLPKYQIYSTFCSDMECCLIKFLHFPCTLCFCMFSGVNTVYTSNQINPSVLSAVSTMYSVYLVYASSLGMGIVFSCILFTASVKSD